MASKRLSSAQLRALKRQHAALTSGTVTIERRFSSAIRGIMAGFHAAMLQGVEATGKAITQDAAGSTPKDPKKAIDRVVDHLIPQIGPKVGKAHDAMSGALQRNYEKTLGKELPSIGLSKLPSHVKSEVALARENSIGYVEKAAQVYASQVREVFGNAEATIGTRWEDLKADLMDRADVSESRAELIARDQTLKLHGAINQARQQSAGLSTYTWSTSGDERVRDEHADLDGYSFSWDSPPMPLGLHPGEDFQCRCIAIPVIDTGEDWTADVEG